MRYGCIKSIRNIKEKDIRPNFGEYSLTEISRFKIVEWLNHMIRKEITQSSANIYLSVLHIMLTEAFCRDILKEDITDKVQSLKKAFKPKRIFTRYIVARLFH